jgi:hypothetical protein
MFSCVECEGGSLLDTAPCDLVSADEHFRRAYCLHHQGALMMEVVHTSETSVQRLHGAESKKLSSSDMLNFYISCSVLLWLCSITYV